MKGPEAQFMGVNEVIMEKNFNKISKPSATSQYTPEGVLKSGVNQEFLLEEKDLPSWIAKNNAEFLLDDTSLINKQAEEFFKKLKENNLDLESINKIIEKFINEYNAYLFGGDASDKGRWIMDDDEIFAAGRRFFDGLAVYDVNHEIINKIIKIYPYYTLGDNQPIFLTDLLKEFFKKNIQAIDQKILTELIINLYANKVINTNTWEMHEDDFWEMHELVFKEYGVNFDNYISSYENNKKSDMEVLKLMRFLKDICWEKLEQGWHWDKIKESYNLLSEQCNSENYIVAEKAKLYVDILDEGMATIERNVIEDIVWARDEDGIAIIYEFYGDRDRLNQEDISKKLKKMRMEERYIYYYRLAKYRPRLSLKSTEIESRKRKFLKSVNCVNGVMSTALEKNLEGSYNNHGELLFINKKDDLSGKISNEEILEEFYSRQKKIYSQYNMDQADENYLFFEFSNLFLRSQIKKDFRISLDDFSLYEQKQFFYFLLNKSRKDVEEVKLFLNKKEHDDTIKYSALKGILNLHYETNKKEINRQSTKSRNNRFRSFLSLEYGSQEMGKKILQIGEKYDQETADKIFAKYAELADYAQDSARYLAKEFNIDDEAKAQEIAEHLLRRGKALLAVCAEENLSSEQVIYKLNNIKAETDIFKESFKLVKSGGEKFSLEKINAIQLKIKAGVELLREEKTVKRMKEIYLENYHNFPEEFKQKIIESLDKKLANPQAKFYTLYHNGEIVAFNSFTPQEDGTVHFANFNVDPRYNYAKLGEAMMEVSLDKESQKNTIVAEAVEGLPIAETYLNKKGFQKTGEIELSGVRLINIRKEKSN